ncbi:glycoside hydrolase family 16 protein [Novipirellula caenicola]|uniref:Glucan endo-1,3-beta-glucosidase A1 n=1 Tax=Novipirellula caenicola TaxID=1536901 RepID=A0ABP9VVB7_9BACT
MSPTQITYGLITPVLISCWFCAVPIAALHAEESGWHLVWSDEFDGERLDYSKWGVEVNAFGGGNEELQLYTDRPENVRVVDGNLIIEARADRPNISGTTRDYSSGKVRTKHRGDWTYGRFEVRAQMPAGQGIWPAIWMLPSEESYGAWAASGEIDIAEYKGQEPSRVHGTLHFGDQWPKNASHTKHYELPIGTFADRFHVFTLEWEPDQIRWYIDGDLYQSQDHWHSAGQPFPAPFNKPFHLLLNLAVGGRFVGAPDSNTTFPLQLRVDYVRVYQKS